MNPKRAKLMQIMFQIISNTIDNDEICVSLLNVAYLNAVETLINMRFKFVQLLHSFPV